MYRPKSRVSKLPLMLTFIVLVAVIIASYIYTGNITSGVQPMIEEELLNPLTSKIDDLLEEAVRSTNYPPD